MGGQASTQLWLPSCIVQAQPIRFLIKYDINEWFRSDALCGAGQGRALYLYSYFPIFADIFQKRNLVGGPDGDERAAAGAQQAAQLRQQPHPSRHAAHVMQHRYANLRVAAAVPRSSRSYISYVILYYYTLIPRYYLLFSFHFPG